VPATPSAGWRGSAGKEAPGHALSWLPSTFEAGEASLPAVHPRREVGLRNWVQPEADDPGRQATPDRTGNRWVPAPRRWPRSPRR
jgi:hypothetical protein